MFNLLPKKDSDYVKAEYVRRRTAALLMFTLMTIAVAFLALIPSHVISWYKLKEVTHTQGLLKENIGVKSRENLNAVISSTNAKIKALTSPNERKATDVLVDITARRTPGVHISQFAFRYDDKQKLMTTVSGVASSRDSILAFVKSLRENEAYSNVDLPISNLAKETDINFTLNITTK